VETSSFRAESDAQDLTNVILKKTKGDVTNG